jgi:CBS domain containing-hemolysin-like protein
MDSMMIIALTLTLVTIFLSGAFSGLETGIYRMSRLRLRLGEEKGDLTYVLLGRAMRDGSSLLLTLLVSNNLANYLATSSVTYLFLAVAPDRTAELLATSLTAPLLFVFGESLPKNLFLYRADVLTSYLGPFLYVVHQGLTWSGIVPLLRLISRLFARLVGAPVPPKRVMVSSQIHQVRTILRDTQEEGLLSHIQTEMLDRVVNIPTLRLIAVMIPMSRVQAIPVQADRTTLLDELRKHAFSRLLVWRDQPSNIVGFVNIYDALAGEAPLQSVESVLRPVRRLDAETLVTDAIEVLRREQVKMILVTRRRGSKDMPVGVVTMKDLVEELMGELAEW